MGMLATAIVITLAFGGLLRRDLANGHADLAPAHAPLAKIAGLVSLVLWAASP